MINYTLHLGDCLEVMPGIPAGSVDAIIADWPYGTTACKWDSVIPLEPLWKECKRVIKRNGAIVLTASQPFTSILVISNLDWFKYERVWDKVSKTDIMNAKNKPLKQHENVLVFSPGTTANGSNNRMTYNPIGVQPGKRKTLQTKTNYGEAMNPRRKSHVLGYYQEQGSNYPSSIITFSNADRSNPLHPTQKPVALMEYLIKTYTNPGDLVLDNTMGSGSTGEACLNTGRRFIGIEKDPGYFEIAKDRLEKVEEKLRQAQIARERQPYLMAEEMTT